MKDIIPDTSYAGLLTVGLWLCVTSICVLCLLNKPTGSFVDFTQSVLPRHMRLSVLAHTVCLYCYDNLHICTVLRQMHYKYVNHNVVQQLVIHAQMSICNVLDIRTR